MERDSKYGELKQEEDQLKNIDSKLLEKLKFEYQELRIAIHRNSVVAWSVITIMIPVSCGLLIYAIQNFVALTPKRMTGCMFASMILLFVLNWIHDRMTYCDKFRLFRMKEIERYLHMLSYNMWKDGKISSKAKNIEKFVETEYYKWWFLPQLRSWHIHSVIWAFTLIIYLIWFILLICKVNLLSYSTLYPIGMVVAWIIVAIIGIIIFCTWRCKEAPTQNKNENKGQEDKKGDDYVNFGILGKIGIIVCVLIFFISVGIIAWFSLNTNFYSIGVGILSVGIALIAVYLADSTDRKIKNQMNGLFLQNLNYIEETRTYYNCGIYDEELLSWKTLQGVIVAYGLNQKIRNKSPILNRYQDQLVKYFRITMECLFERLGEENKTWVNLPINKKNNFAEAYAMVEDFYAEDNTWKEFNKLLTEKMEKEELEDLTTRKNNAKSQIKLDSSLSI